MKFTIVLHAKAGNSICHKLFAGIISLTNREVRDIDSRRTDRATKEFTITITSPAISGTLNGGTVKKSYSGTLKASGGTASYTWSISKGSLPTGLTLNKSTGKISGTPTKAGKYSFTVKITDKNKATATKAYTVTIAEASKSTSKSTSKTATTNNTKNTKETVKSENKVSQGYYGEAVTVYTTPVNVGTNAGYYAIELRVVSDDMLSQGEGRDEDLVSVRANQPVRFIATGNANHESDVEVYIDDEAVEGITVSDEGEFTVPADMVHDDFKVQVKAGKLESQELYINAIKQ